MRRYESRAAGCRRWRAEEDAVEVTAGMPTVTSPNRWWLSGCGPAPSGRLAATTQARDAESDAVGDASRPTAMPDGRRRR